jgi:hypothetical protein
VTLRILTGIINVLPTPVKRKMKRLGALRYMTSCTPEKRVPCTPDYL